MSTLATEFHPVGTELPAVAFLRIALAPVVCVLGLMLCMLVHEEPFTARYAVVAMAAFFLSARIFGELPLAANGRSRLAFIVPSHTIIADWVAVIGILLFLAFLTKVSAFYSRKVVLTWFAITPFLLNGAQEVAWRILTRVVSSGTAVRTKVIVGVNQVGCDLASKIDEDPCLGVVRGFFDDRSNGRLEGARGRQILGTLRDVADFVKRASINVVYVTLPMSQDPRIVRLLMDLRDTTASVYFAPNTSAKSR
jgi:putative colanic acid biosynthesis UDP-glucose lipid carrier transferase